jgi:phage terminase small subunit
MAGRKRKPSAIRELEGDHHKSRYNPDEPKPPVVQTDMTPPEWLPDEGRRMWFRLAPVLRNIGVLTVADLPAFEALCSCYNSWRDNPEDMKRLARLQSLLSEFGCTPSSRSRLTGATNQQSEDPMERLLANGV